MSIFEELLQRVSNGESFYIDFTNKIMKVGKQKIIDEGQYDPDRNLINDDICDMEDILHTIETLYQNYKYSVPSERSERKRKTYFKPLHVDQLTDEQLVLGEYREVSQAALEGFILCMIIQEKFIWNDDTMGKWFWESKNDADLILLKDWFN